MSKLDVRITALETLTETDPPTLPIIWRYDDGTGTTPPPPPGFRVGIITVARATETLEEVQNDEA